MTEHLDGTAWARFQAVIENLRSGDVLTVADAVSETGMQAASAQLMLDALTRAELFTQRGRYFVRVRSVDPLAIPRIAR